MECACLKWDPYAIKEWIKEPEKLPNVSWTDLTCYMVATPSPYTQETIKAWKGMLDSKNFVASGWVHDLSLYSFKTAGSHEKFLIKAKVKHSQRVSSTFLLPWVIIDESGTVETAHYTCMAGLGEACTHIAATVTCVINAVEARMKAGTSCTSQPCYWLPVKRDVVAADILDISFSKPNKRRKVTPECPINVGIEPPSENEVHVFFKKINGASSKPAILKIIPPYRAVCSFDLQCTVPKTPT